MSDYVEENNYNPIDEGPENNTEQRENKVTFDEKNYLNTRLKENETKKEIKIRIVLTEDIDGRKKAAIPIQIHSLKLTREQNQEFRVSKSAYKSFICLNDRHVSDGSGCPLCNKKRELFEEANKYKDVDEQKRKAMCFEAYHYDTKTAYVARVIERGHEEDGVKFWRFNKHDDGTGILDAIKENYEAYKSAGTDIFNYQTGHDIKIILTKKPETNSKGVTKEKVGIKIMVDVVPSPLSTDSEQIEAWVNDEKDWRDMYKTKSYDYLQLIADGDTPVFNRDENRYVKFVPREGGANERYNTETVYNETVNEQPVQVQNQDEEDLPF